MSEGRRGSPRDRTVTALAVAIAAVAAGVYANTLANGFALDDLILIEPNPIVRVLDPRVHFSNDYFGRFSKSGYYRPLVSNSFAVNFAIGGLDPSGYHAVNVALHAIASAAVCMLAWLLVRDRWFAGAAGLLFAVHAVHTEAVANVSGRPDLLAASFTLLALLAHVVAAQREPRSSPALRIASLSCFGLGLLCKENSITLIGLVMLYDFVYGGRALSFAAFRALFGRRFLRVYAPYLGVVLAYGALRLAVMGPTPPQHEVVNNPLLELSAGPRIATALWIAVRYLWLLVFPLHLSYDYGWKEIAPVVSFGDPRLWAGVAMCGAAVAALAVARRLSRDWFFALGFYAITFSIVSNLIVALGTNLGERLIYLPSVAFCLAVGLALRALVGARPGRRRAIGAVAGVALAAAVGLHGWRAVERNRDWKSSIDLWLHDVAVTPRSVKVVSNAGVALLARDRPEEALARFDEAIAMGLPPEHFEGPWRGSIFALAALDRYAEAGERYAVMRRAGYPRNATLEAAVAGELSLRDVLGK